jgi:hypothetical protein
MPEAPAMKKPENPAVTRPAAMRTYGNLRLRFMVPQFVAFVDSRLDFIEALVAVPLVSSTEPTNGIRRTNHGRDTRQEGSDDMEINC